MRVKVSELIRQNVGVGNDVEDFLAETLLHLNDVFTKAIFPCQLVRHREVVDLLKLIHLVVHKGFDALGGPEDVPLVAFGLAKPIRFHNGFDKFGICLDHLEKHIELCLLVLTWLRVAEHCHPVTVDLHMRKTY